MMNKKAVKVICIILAALMGLSCIAVLTQVFAAENVLPAPPKMGDNEMRYILPIAIIVLAVIIIVVCVVLPKLKKKDDGK